MNQNIGKAKPDNEKLSDTKLVLESKISLLKNENSSKDSKMSLLKKENAAKDEEISLNNEKIESLTKEVKSLEQDYQLVVADLILKSNSLDSISLKLDSIINVDNTSERAWSSMNARKDYYNFDDNTDKLRQLLQVILESRVHTVMSIYKNEIQGDSEIVYEYKRNIKESFIYKRDFGFKTLVDVIYEQGFVICMQEGRYYVEPKSNKCQGEQLEYD